MYRRLVISSAVLAVVWAVSSTQAQVSSAFPPMALPTGAAPMPMPFKMKAVAGKPYSLTAKTTDSKRLADGTWTTTVLEARKMRDSEGRERSELINRSGGPPVVSLTDPIAQTFVTLSWSDKTATVTHVPLPKPLTPEQEARAAESRAKAAEYRATHPSPDTSTLPPKTIAGASAEGKEQIITLHAAKLSGGEPVRVVEDTWTAPDLSIPLESTSDDPRGQKIITIVTDLQRAEPDPSLFHIPADYKIVERKN